MGKIIAVCAGREKGQEKRSVGQASLASGFGLSGDCDAGKGSVRQIAIFSYEKFCEMKQENQEMQYGHMGEHLLVEGLDLFSLKDGDQLRSGDIVLRVSKTPEANDGSQNNTENRQDQCLCCQVIFGGIVTEGDVILKE